MHVRSWGIDILPIRLWTLRLLEQLSSSVGLGRCEIFYTPWCFKICQVIAKIGYPGDIKSVNDQGQLQRIQYSALSESFVGNEVGVALQKQCDLDAKP